MNAFDDNLKNRAGGFRLEPRKEVWERVTEELDKKKRKRRLVWFWWFAPLLLAGGAVWFTQSPSGETGKAVVGVHRTAPSPDEEKGSTALTEKETKPALAGQNEISANNNRSVQETTTPNTPPFTPSSSGKGVVLSKRPPEAESSPILEKSTGVSETSMLTSARDSFVTVSISEPIQKTAANIADTIAFTATVQEATTHVKPDSAISMEKTYSLPDTAESNLKDSMITLSNPKIAPEKPKKPSKGSWLVLAGTGIHNLTGKGISLEKRMADYYSGGFSNNAGGGQGSNTPSLQSPEPGWGMMLGIERRQPFGNSRRWSWLGGLHYQYQSFSISTGAIKDSALNYSTDRGNVTAANYYLAGSSLQQKGSQHRLHLLAALQWHMDKKQQWSWQNGLYGGIVLSQDYLIPHNAPRGWVPAEGLTQKGYFGIETGFLFNQAKWGAGIFGQYNLTNSLNITGPAPQYWRGVELRVQYKLSSNTLKK